MDTNQFTLNIKKLTRQRNSAYTLIILMALSLLFTSAAAFFKKERVVVVPTLGEPYTLASNDEVYLEKMGVFLSNLFLNRSPVDASWRNRNILKHTAPIFYHDLKHRLDQECEFMSENKEQAFIFYPHKSEADIKTLSFTTEGNRVVFVGKDGSKTHISQQDEKRYRFGFIRNGDQLLLASIKMENIK